jgi:exopolysaccharide biosynthesis protein
MVNKNSLFLIIVILCMVQNCFAEPWWSKQNVEDTRVVAEGIAYRQILFTTVANEPIRAHVVTVSHLESQYIFGVLGSFGTHFTTSAFAKQSKAIIAVNGGFFSTRPSRASGLVMAHSRILYPPLVPRFTGTVGFSSKGLLIDKIEESDLNGFMLSTAKEGWNDCHAALGAGPILLKSASNVLQPSEDAFYTARHPRTGIGKTNTEEAIIIVVDGRQTEWSVGVSLDEFANIFLELGAIDALNLDGGGSSTMVINEEVVNHPADLAMGGKPGIERAVANVITLFQRDAAAP